METAADFIFLGSKITVDSDNQWNEKTLTPWKKSYDKPSSVQLLSHVRLCDPMNHSTPGLPDHHQLPESTQTHVHWVGDAIQPSHPLSSPSPPALNLYQIQGLFKWVSSSHQVAKVLEFQPQHQSFRLVGSPCSPRDSQESSATPQFKTICSSVLSFLYSPALYWQGLWVQQTCVTQPVA